MKILKFSKPKFEPFKCYVHEKIKKRRLWILFRSLTYNSHFSWMYVLDTLMSPLFHFVDNYVRFLGPAFVGFLMSMMGLVIVTCYVVMVPYEWVRLPYSVVIPIFAMGHWLLINTLFHYWMAFVTKPGFPPAGFLIEEAVSICKHCIAPKPPRTHHCSVCRRCVLKMDHHCPWLDQCVGHFNHRYFYLCMLYMWLGCAFITAGSFRCFLEHFWYPENNPTAKWCRSLESQLFYASYLCSESDYPRKLKVIDETGNSTTIEMTRGVVAYNSIVLVFFTASAMVVGLGALLAWHTRLISRGETSIEQHINEETSRKYAKEGKSYTNPYNFGLKENWRLFLGLSHSKFSFFWRIILPSRHPPFGNGLHYESAVYRLDTVNIEKLQL